MKTPPVPSRGQQQDVFCRGTLPLQSLHSRHRSWHCRTEGGRGAGAALRHPELCGASASPVAWAQLRTQPSELCPSHHCGSSACCRPRPPAMLRRLSWEETPPEDEGAQRGCGSCKRRSMGGEGTFGGLRVSNKSSSAGDTKHSSEGSRVKQRCVCDRVRLTGGSQELGEGRKAARQLPDG